MKLTNVYGLSPSIVRCVQNDTYQGPKGELDRVSATSIIDSPKIHYLKCRHWDELEDDVSNRLWALLGTSVHAMLERAEDANTIKEERIDHELDGITISGQMDVLSEHRIEDWKTTSVYKIIYNPNGDPGWIKQLNIYAWLASKKGFSIKEIVVNAILRDHQASKAKTEQTYPQTPFVTINIPVWTPEQTEAYLKERVKLFKSCKDLPDSKLPNCTPEEMWQKDTSYALMREGRKTAVKVCPTKEEAIAALPGCFGCKIVERLGTPNRCMDYCIVNRFCPQYMEYMKGLEK